MLSWLLGPSFHTIFNMRRAFMAAHTLRAITATPACTCIGFPVPSNCTIFSTPGTVLASESSTELMEPPLTGHLATTAYAIPGICRSMPYLALPVKISFWFLLRCSLPIMVKSLTFFRVTSVGTGNKAASQANSPYVSRLPLRACTTAPFSALHKWGATCHF